MSYDQWWMGIRAGGKHFHLWFTLEDGRLFVTLTDQDQEAQWEGHNRERPILDLKPRIPGELTLYNIEGEITVHMKVNPSSRPVRRAGRIPPSALDSAPSVRPLPVSPNQNIHFAGPRSLARAGCSTSL